MSEVLLLVVGWLVVSGWVLLEQVDDLQVAFGLLLGLILTQQLLGLLLLLLLLLLVFHLRGVLYNFLDDFTLCHV